MYKVNLLPRKVLITPDEVIAQGPTDGTVDPRNILQAIQIAEERFVKKAICKDLYNDICSIKNVIVTDLNKTFLESESGLTLTVGSMLNASEFLNDSYRELWNEHLWKLVAECVVYIATPTNWSKYQSQGEMQLNPKSIAQFNEGSNAASASLKDVQWKLDKLLQDRIDPLIASVQEYICENIGSFPMYNCRKCDCGNNDGVGFNRKTGWIHGLYGNRKESCCEKDY
jgi:hypothetical protein